MKLQQVTVTYEASAKPRGWFSMKISHESDSPPDVIFRAALDDAVTAIEVADFVQTVTDEHHRKHGVDISGQAATSALEFFGHVSKRGETTRL